MAWIRRSQCLMFLTLFAALLPVLQIETHHWLWSCYLVTIFDCGMAARYLKLYCATVSWRLLFCANFREKGGFTAVLHRPAKGSFDLVTISARKHIWHYYYYHALISNFTLISALLRNSLDMRSHGHWLLTDFWILLIYSISLVPSAISQKWFISVIGTMRGCSAFGVIASGHGWFLLPPYCPRGLELPHIRGDCRMCQQLVPHVF